MKLRTFADVGREAAGEVVDRDDLMADLETMPGDMGPDETGCPRN
jgi:hypothetical protein